MRKRPVVLCCVLVVLIATAPAGFAQQSDASLVAQVQAVPPAPRNLTAAELEQRGDELRARKQSLEALEYYAAALKLGPRTASLYNKAGIANLQVQRFGVAKRCFDLAIKADRTAPEAYNNLGAIAYLQKKYSRAIGQYQKAIQLRPEGAAFHSNLGTTYFARKQFPDAANEYATAWNLDHDVFTHSAAVGVSARLMSPEDRAHFDFLLARMFAENLQLDDSLRYLRRAIEEGYGKVREVYESSAFAALRADPRFTELMQNQPPGIH
jgi:tetratricopeptide (TPR) repeat protein